MPFFFWPLNSFILFYSLSFSFIHVFILTIGFQLNCPQLPPHPTLSLNGSLFWIVYIYYSLYFIWIVYANGSRENCPPPGRLLPNLFFSSFQRCKTIRFLFFYPILLFILSRLFCSLSFLFNSSIYLTRFLPVLLLFVPCCIFSFFIRCFYVVTTFRSGLFHQPTLWRRVWIATPTSSAIVEFVIVHLYFLPLALTTTIRCVLAIQHYTL